MIPVLDEWEVSTDDVIIDQLLGEGAFGEVYKGEVRGPLENPKIPADLREAFNVPVAIKLIKSEYTHILLLNNIIDKVNL